MTIKQFVNRRAASQLKVIFSEILLMNNTQPERFADVLQVTLKSVYHGYLWLYQRVAEKLVIFDSSRCSQCFRYQRAF